MRLQVWIEFLRCARCWATNLSHHTDVVFFRWMATNFTCLLSDTSITLKNWSTSLNQSKKSLIPIVLKNIGISGLARNQNDCIALPCYTPHPSLAHLHTPIKPSCWATMMNLQSPASSMMLLNSSWKNLFSSCGRPSYLSLLDKPALLSRAELPLLFLCWFTLMVKAPSCSLSLATVSAKALMSTTTSATGWSTMMTLIDAQSCCYLCSSFLLLRLVVDAGLPLLLMLPFLPSLPPSYLGLS